LGEADEDEMAQVNKRLAEDVVYKKYFEQFKTIWDSSKNIAVQSTTDENAAWQRFKNRVTYQQQNVQPVQKNKFSWMKVAAAVIVLIGIGVISFLLINKENPVKDIAVQSLQQVVNDTLSDASVVTLNKNSTLTYPEKFKGKTRTVVLKGEAFFKITPNKEKPFIIAVNDVQVKVVGTSFNIKEINGNTEIVVETGIVQVTKNGQTVELKAGEKINVAQGNAALAKETINDKLYNYYRTKEFVCDETPLWKLVEVLNEAYGADIAIKNNAIKNLPITTTFLNESLEQVLLVISETFNITVIKKDNRIILQ
jgi:transmembrane sensor